MVAGCLFDYDQCKQSLHIKCQSTVQTLGSQEGHKMSSNGISIVNLVL